MDLADLARPDDDRQLGFDITPPAPARSGSPASIRATSSSAAPAALRPRKRAVFAGLTRAQLSALALGLAVLAWGAWATKTLVALQYKRVVTVRLSQMISDLVTSEARSGDSQQVAAQRTQAFMIGLDAVLKKHAAEGATVLVGEAVIAGTVPDITAQVNAEVAKVVMLPTSLAPASSSVPAIVTGPAPQQSPLPVSPSQGSPSIGLSPSAPSASSAPAVSSAQANPFAGVSAPTGAGEDAQ